ncbi:nicotinate-nucleotide adenylyltransferase [Chloroflexota bacterium]
MKIGLLGGTFDPIHIGHLIIAQEVRVQLDIDKIVFIPASHPWLKMDREITDAQHRLAMIKLAIDSDSCFEVSTAELDRPGPTYTVDTVEALKAESNPMDELYFIVGSDALADFPRWKEPERVVSLCNIVQVERPGSSNIDPVDLKPLIPGVLSCLRSVGVPQIDISSTAIRERVMMGYPIRYMVPPDVEAYIYEHGLYSR